MSDAAVLSPPADPRAFRDALGRFATGVAVVTAVTDDGARAGMTISSFNSVSLDPPLVLFSIGRKAHSLPLLLRARSFAVNVLAHDQRAVADAFARPLTDKWSGLSISEAPGEAALIDDALAQFRCAPHASHDGGDHVIFVARVLGFAASDRTAPLVFHAGAYTSTGAPQ